jgi:hypothetical protein
MSGSTYKGVMVQDNEDGTGILLEEQSVTSTSGYGEWSPKHDSRIYDLGTYDRVTADWIHSRLKQRFPEMSEPLTEEEVYLIRQQIVDRIL